MSKNHVISVLVKDEAGIVSRVSGLFSGRGYSIESITAAQTSEKGYARLTVEIGRASCRERVLFLV